MRLSHIKLAGFKSFVDPTHIPVPGKLVGVVGPNGCGKSNVIDAVRWVLGESSARHLRGETMQDVIFNGSSQRKPVNRASVELVFDNSLGRAVGAWSKYAEISVKRVLERDGESCYYINNLHVRRRDVADIFLGTGLGGRAYAIIEQGMISRMVEAKPEELRTFLEEAAGISKYRDRRRDTELRLEDTRENLQRVDDILQELNKQLTHLEEQAEVATRYRNLESSLKTSQQLFWLLRRQEAENQRSRMARELAQLGLELEAETTRLRTLEAQVEQVRQSHYAAADEVHAAQGGLYEVNAEAARCEQSLQHQRDSRRRVESQLGALAQEQQQADGDLTQTRLALSDRQAELEHVRLRLEEARQAAATAAEGLPDAQAAFDAARTRVEALQQALARDRQAEQVEQTRAEHAQRILTQLNQRRERLIQEREQLQDADPEALRLALDQLAEIDSLHQNQRTALAQADSDLPALEQRHRDANEACEAVIREVNALEARLTALELLQKQVSRSGEIHAWLDNHQLDGLGRLWQGIRVTPGWEDALEAVLRERLNAIAVEDLQQVGHWLDQPPPGKLSFFRKVGSDSPGVTLAGRRPLAELVTCIDAGLAAVLADWLEQVYVVEDPAQGVIQAADLPAGALLVCPNGHVFTRSSVSFHAVDSEVHGILARQRQIEQLQQQHLAREAEVAGLKQAVEAAAAELEDSRARTQKLRHEVEHLQQQRHELELEHLRLSQEIEQRYRRRTQLAVELDEIDAQTRHENSQHQQASDALERLVAALSADAATLLEAQDQHGGAAAHLSERRVQAHAAEQKLQEAGFGQRLLEEKIKDLEGNINVGLEKLARLSAGRTKLQQELTGLDDATLQAALDQVLARRLEREQVLSTCRQQLDDAETHLKETEQQRLACEQKLDPLRERLGEVRLKEQEARLAEEGYVAQLAEAGADPAILEQKLEKGMRPGGLQNEINRLSQEIEALGAVNLAALEELRVGKDRKTYLDSQALDLRQAVETLESAIKRIDRETRERLQATFDEANRHFGEMFPALFGGGEARLLMTGEEILDAGVQVIARPPGKRNTSIHLLSGGEKALTALSLVFSLFQLNPAPFCLLDEVDAPLDDSNTERFCDLVRKMAQHTQFMFISHNKITMEMAEQLVGITMPEQGVSKVVAVDIEEALKLNEEVAA